jgi:hypothetical protein
MSMTEALEMISCRSRSSSPEVHALVLLFFRFGFSGGIYFHRLTAPLQRNGPSERGDAEAVLSLPCAGGRPARFPEHPSPQNVPLFHLRLQPHLYKPADGFGAAGAIADCGSDNVAQ